MSESKGKAKEQEARDLMRSHTGEPDALAGNKIFDNGTLNTHMLLKVYTQVLNNA